MTLWDVLLGRWGVQRAPSSPPVDLSETEVYRQHMAQAQAAKERAERILASYSETKTVTNRPAQAGHF